MGSSAPVQPGDFCCVPISGAGGVLIRIGERLNGDAFTQYQHAEVYVGTSDTLLAKYLSTAATAKLIQSRVAPYGWTLGAYPGGARLVPLPCSPSELPGALWSSGAFDITSDERQRIISTALSCQGIGYSSLDYFALAAHRFRIPVPELREYIASTGHMLCSQLVDYCYLNAGVHLFTDERWPGYVTPAALATLIHSRLEGGVTHGSRMLWLTQLNTR